MAYLGICNNEELNGLYSFDVISMCEKVRDLVKGSVLYTDGRKKDAFAKFNITSDNEVKDGSILIKKFKDVLSEKAYIVLEGTPYDGVYFFYSKEVRNREAKNFPNAFLTMSKEEILSKYNIGESEIQDGGFLLSKEVRNYLKNVKDKQNKVVEKNKEPEKKEVEVASDVEKKSDKKSKKNTVTPDDVKDKNTTQMQVDANNNNLLRKMMSFLANTYDVVEIMMSTGEKYRIAVRDFFYADPNCSFANCAYTDSANNIMLKEKAVDALLDAGDIAVVEATRIKYYDGFAVIRNCDDAYSPNINHDKMGRILITHSIPEVVINVNQIVSVTGFSDYTEINMNKITPEKNKMIFEYLKSKIK